MYNIAHAKDMNLGEPSKKNLRILRHWSKRWVGTQEGYIEELTQFSQCLNEKTGYVNF